LEGWAPGKPLRQFIAWTDIEVFQESGALGQKTGEEVYFLYVGVLIPRKGIHILLDAFARVIHDFPDAKLLIIGGPENPEYAVSLKERVLSLGLKDKVVFRKPVSQKELAQYMVRSEVLILPSFSEALGLVVLEAMATGTPVIGSDIGGIPDLIEDGVTGFLVPPGDVLFLADRLRWVLQNRKETASMGRRAKEFATKIYSSESYIQHYDLLFKIATDVR
jgi:glycosyltransferase involved in cell wall biosynthesis